MKYKYFLSIAAVVSFLFSCEKIIEFNGDEVKTKLVLNGLLTSDSIVKIQLTESRFFLDGRPFNPINDAEVTLWKDGDSIESLQNTGEGYYTGTYVPREGDNLRITASHSRLDPIECETQIVSPTPVIAVDTAFNRTIFYTYGYEYENEVWTVTDSTAHCELGGDITITFNDPADIAGYYLLTLDLYTRYANGRVDIRPLYFTSDDMVFQTNNELPFNDKDGDSRALHLFSDELFDGKEDKQLKIKLGKSSISYLPGTDTNYKIRVTLQSLSPSYYMYLKTREANSDSDLFTEPVQIYTNIKGGIGIFGNYSNSTYRIELN
jgi:hypothetical protein